MDTRIIDYLAALSELSRVEADNIQVHIPTKRTTSITGKTVIIVVSQSEPHDIPLPDNVLWACYDKVSPMYKKLYKRTSFDSTLMTENTWQQVTDYEAIWETQTYVEGGGSPSTGLGLATTTNLGIVTLASAPLDSSYPEVVVIEDSRNTDTRTPLPHEEMHENKPAEAWVHSSGETILVAGQAPDTSIMLGTSTGPVYYAQLTRSDIYADRYPYSEFVVAQTPDMLEEAPFTGAIILKDIADRVNGYTIGESVELVVAVYGNSIDAEGFKNFLGYYQPSTIKQNGATVSGCIIDSGDNILEVTIENALYTTLSLTINLKGV